MKTNRAQDVAVLRHILSTEFYLFCHYYDPEFFTDARKHLKLICDELQAVAEGKILRLMMSLPPRAGKSYTTSLWCAWMIGRGRLNPATSIMRNSYGQTLAEKFSYDVRQIVQSQKFQDVFPGVALVEDHARIEDWAVKGAKQSTYFCAGVGGAITGKGCQTAAILDDPVKNLEDALSELVLDKTWLWYLSTHRSRMESGCPEIHIATRWSQRDPIGKILDSEESKDYRKIVIPALNEKGLSFCESIKTTSEYQEMKRLLDDFIWEAEYMQNPIEAKGLLFPASDLQRFTLKELKPERVSSVIGYTDTADEGTDFLASVAVAISGDRFYVVDVVFTQDPVEVTEAQVAQLIANTGQIKHTVESNSGGKGFARMLQQNLKGKSQCHVSWRPTTQNKETRILMASGEIKERFVFRSDYGSGSDYDKFMRQLTSYVKMGRNSHDDAPDALTGLAEEVFTPRMRFLSSGRNN